MSSVALEAQVEYEHSANPLRLQAELVRYLTTSCNYVRKQGLTDEQIRETVAIALSRAAVIPRDGVVVPKPQLLDKGINDMRVNRDATDG